MQEAKLSILHWARREVVSTLYAESLILANISAAAISWMQSKRPSSNSPGFPRFTIPTRSAATLHRSRSRRRRLVVVVVLHCTRRPETPSSPPVSIIMNQKPELILRARKDFGIALRDWEESWKLQRLINGGRLREEERERFVCLLAYTALQEGVGLVGLFIDFVLYSLHIIIQYWLGAYLIICLKLQRIK